MEISVIKINNIEIEIIDKDTPLEKIVLPGKLKENRHKYLKKYTEDLHNKTLDVKKEVKKSKRGRPKKEVKQ